MRREWVSLMETRSFTRMTWLGLENDLPLFFFWTVCNPPAYPLCEIRLFRFSTAIEKIIIKKSVERFISSFILKHRDKENDTYIYRFFNVACNKDAAHFFDPPHHGLIWHSSIPFSLTSDHKHQKSPSRGRYLPFSSIRGTRWPRKPSPPPPSSPALVNFPIVASGFNGSNRINTRIRPRILARNNEF